VNRSNEHETIYETIDDKVVNCDSTTARKPAYVDWATSATGFEPRSGANVWSEVGLDDDSEESRGTPMSLLILTYFVGWATVMVTVIFVGLFLQGFALTGWLIGGLIGWLDQLEAFEARIGEAIKDKLMEVWTND